MTQPRESKTSARRVLAKQMAAQAVENRKIGYTYEQIAEALVFPDSDPPRPYYKSKQAVFHAVKTALERVIEEPAKELRTLDLQRLDALLVNPYQKALNGDLFALSATLQILQRRARLLGLDAPLKQELSGPEGEPITHKVQSADTMSDAERAARIAALLDLARTRRDNDSAANGSAVDPVPGTASGGTEQPG